MVHDEVGWLDVEVGVQKPRSRERVVSRQGWHGMACIGRGGCSPLVLLLS